MVFALAVLAPSHVSATPQSSVYVVLLQTPTRSITVGGGAVTLPTIAETNGMGETATGASLSYGTTGSNESVTAEIDSGTAEGVTLAVRASNIACALPCGGTAYGTSTGDYVTLSTTPTPIIQVISEIVGGHVTADLTYKITTSSASAGEATKTVTFTIGA